jgi:hypothetical protein
VGQLNAQQVGPFFFSEKTVTGRSYWDMLELYALPKLPPQTILQQDGVPPHFCHHVRNHLDREMAGRWIGRGGPITWPPRSPDFFLWGYVKNIVYQVKINNLQHLKAHIRDAVVMVTPNMLHVMPPSKPTSKFIEKVVYSEKTSILSLCNGQIHKCV